MTSRNAQRTALITGSYRGIGLETARQLAGRGFHAILTSRDEKKGQTATECVRRHGGAVSFLPLDVSSSESIQNAVSRFGTIADRLNVLINNAAVYPDADVTVLTISRERLART